MSARSRLMENPRWTRAGVDALVRDLRAILVAGPAVAKMRNKTAKRKS